MSEAKITILMRNNGKKVICYTANDLCQSYVGIEKSEEQTFQLIFVSVVRLKIHKLQTPNVGHYLEDAGESVLWNL